MAVYVLKWADRGGNGSVAYPDCAGDVIQNRYEADLASTPLKGVTLGVGDIIDFGIIPANTTVTDLLIDSDDLDSNGSPTLAYDVGVLTGTPGETTGRTCGTEFFAATNASQSAAVTRMSKGTGFRVAPVGYDRSIGIKITTAAATQPSTGTLALALNVKG
jgi:hypothetical protein